MGHQDYENFPWCCLVSSAFAHQMYNLLAYCPPPGIEVDHCKISYRTNNLYIRTVRKFKFHLQLLNLIQTLPSVLNICSCWMNFYRGLTRYFIVYLVQTNLTAISNEAPIERHTALRPPHQHHFWNDWKGNLTPETYLLFRLYRWLWYSVRRELLWHIGTWISWKTSTKSGLRHEIRPVNKASSNNLWSIEVSPKSNKSISPG